MSRREHLVVTSADDELPVEVRDLLAELENDRGVQLALELQCLGRLRVPVRITLFKQILRREKKEKACYRRLGL